MNNEFLIKISSCGISPYYLVEDKNVNIAGNIDLSEIEIISIALAMKKYNDIKNNFEITDFLASQGESLDNYFSRINISKNNEFTKEIVVNKDGNVIEENLENQDNKTK